MVESLAPLSAVDPPRKPTTSTILAGSQGVPVTPQLHWLTTRALQSHLQCAADANGGHQRAAKQLLQVDLVMVVMVVVAPPVCY